MTTSATGGTSALSRTRSYNAVLSHFERRAKAALRGVHLPSEEELLLGMPFLAESITADVREFATRFEGSLQRRSAGSLEGLQQLVRELAASPCMEGVASLSALLRSDELARGGITEAETHRLLIRCETYGASWGSSRSAATLAVETMALALLSEGEAPVVSKFAFRALNLLALACGLEKTRPVGSDGTVFFIARPDTALQHDFLLGDRLGLTLARRGEPLIEDSIAAAPADTSFSARTEQGESKVIVVTEVGNATTTEGKKVAIALQPITGIELPLVTPSDLPAAWKTMRSEYPHAVEVVDRIFEGLAGNPCRISPTILIGAPGSGKSRFARRLGEVLSLRTDFIAFAGMADSAVMGTARRWSTGEPSFAVTSILRHLVANPLLVVDEVEKAADGGHNGNAQHALLPLLERETARAFMDPWVQATVDVSYVSWVLTANSVQPILGPLRDRCIIMTFPSPGREHVDTLSNAMIADIVHERGEVFATHHLLDGTERLALGQWTDGSLRTLKKMLVHIFDQRDKRARELPN